MRLASRITVSHQNMQQYSFCPHHMVALDKNKNIVSQKQAKKFDKAIKIKFTYIIFIEFLSILIE